jgi:hypothetical protein
MADNNNIETEAAAVASQETQEKSNAANEEEVHFGVELDETEERRIQLADYLRNLEAEFAPTGPSEEALRKIKFDLESIDKIDQVPVNPNDVSRTLLAVFENMKAWEMQMRAVSHMTEEGSHDALLRRSESKQIFKESCEKLYPGLNPSTTLIGSELLRIDREVRSLELPGIKLRLIQLQDIGQTANSIDPVNKPVEAVQELEKIMQPIAAGVEKDLQAQNLTEQAQNQLDLCVQILFKLQTMIDTIKRGETYKAAFLKEQKLRGKGETVSKEEEKTEEIAQAEAVWNANLRDQLGTMEEWFESDSRLGINPLKLNVDVERANHLAENLPSIWEAYKDDERPAARKTDPFKLRMGELLKNVF